MSVIEQVQYETSVRKRYAAITFAAAVLIVISQLIQLSGPKADVSELTLNLVVANIRAARDIVATALQGTAYLGVGVALLWMHRIARARNAQARSFVRYLIIVGAPLAALLLVAFTVVFCIKAGDFVSSGSQSYPEAKNLVGGIGLIIVNLLYEFGELLLAIGFVLVALNMMRVGLFTRVLGFTGVVAGALLILPLLGNLTPIIQGLWLAAVAVLFFGRWPSGDPPAWESGLSVPWQPMQQTTGDARVRREARPREQRRRTRMGELPTIVEPEATPESSGTPRTPQKRKRKRRN